MAAQALKDLQEVAKGPNRPVIYTPPEMIPQWQPTFALQLKQAVSAALDAGVAADKVFKLLDSIATVDLDGLPDDLLALCIEAGLGADTDMDGETLLHYLLNTEYPIPLGNLNSSSAAADSKQQSVLQLDEQSEAILQKLQELQHTIPAQHHAACGSVTLAELLHRGASPDLPDSSGNTALHMIAACMIRKRHFPDPQVVGQTSNQHNQGAGTDPNTEAFTSSKGSSAQTASTAAAGGGQQQQLEDNDAARAAYAAAAFTALVRTGWDPAVRNSNGYTVSDLLLEGLQRYQTGAVAWLRSIALCWHVGIKTHTCICLA